MRSPNSARLLAKLDSATTSSSGDLTPILLCAPAGYGKSKLASEWLAQQGKYRVVRLRCLPDSRDTLWEDLAHAINSTLGTRIDLTQNPRRALPRAAAQLTEPTVLLIEDYHFATTPENDLGLLDLIGPSLRLLVVARRTRILGGPLAARRVPMLTVTLEDLAFTPTEANDHAISRFHAPDSPLTAAALELAHGWPLAVRAAFAPTAAPIGGADPYPTHPAFPLDPLAALTRFALNQLKTVTEPARTILLASTLVDVIDLHEARNLVSDTPDHGEPPSHRARDAVNELLELGLLLPAASGDTEEFSCHPAIKRGLASRVEGSLTLEQRTSIVRNRAARIASISPLTAFRMFLSIADYEQAELVLAQHFATITDEPSANNAELRSLTQDVLLAHPTFVAARLHLARADTNIPYSTISYLLSLWQRGLHRVQQRLDDTGDMRAPYLLQAMIAARLTGQVAAANRIARELEAQVDATGVFTPDPQHIGFGARRVVGSGSLPVYLRELGTTALIAGDLSRARSIWERLRAHAEKLITHPWHGFPASSTRTVSDVESGRTWLLGALSEMALTEVLDGNINRAAQYLAEADTLSTTTGTQAANVTWVSGEIARAHLAYELCDETLLRRAQTALAPMLERAEHWALLLIAEAAERLASRGVAWALPHMESGLAHITETGQNPRGWFPVVQAYHAMLATVSSHLDTTERVIEAMPEGSPATLVERARQALFAHDNVRAILLTHEISDAVASHRQRAQRCLIIACASWSTDQTGEAFDAFDRATSIIIDFGLRSALRTVPYDVLVELADASLAAGRADAVDLVASVPVAARARRYEKLTDMEQRTLDAIRDHGTINDTADFLYITPATVKKHLNAVYRKLDVKGRDEALLRAGRMGLLV